MAKEISIPVGARVRVTRQDGSSKTRVFRGTDEKGEIYEGENDERDFDLGIYTEVEVNTGDGWRRIFP